MHGCQKCCKVTAWMFLIVGVLFLLTDIGMWNFWGLNWWTVLFLLMGITGVAKASCSECQAMAKKK
jgi:hypothetical protein